jgi:uncharacterized C2H2 Zn-finger protein
MSEKKTNSLLNGRFLKCPRCETEKDILSYVPLAEIDKYATETQQILKCRDCSWVFALSLAYGEFSGNYWKVKEDSGA